MKLAAVLACRNQSSRLYAKPLQNLGVKQSVSILDFMVAQLRRCPQIADVVLAISEQEENRIYVKQAERYGIPYVMGDDDDVLGRLLKGAEKVGAAHVFRVTTESPYPYLDDVGALFKYHVDNGIDYTSTSGLPDGSYYEIISVKALKTSWDKGQKKHRSELCTLYINEYRDQFRIIQHQVPEALRRPRDIRLTVDWPEDLIVMRALYEGLGLAPDNPYALADIIRFLDEHPKINQINNWIDSGIGRVWY